MSEKIDGTHDDDGSQGTAASRLLSSTNIWSDAPSPPPAPKPVPASATCSRIASSCSGRSRNRCCACAAARRTMAAAKIVAGPPGRRQLCRLHLGRAGAAAGRADHRIRHDQRRQRRRHQRAASGLRPCRRRPRRRAQPAEPVLGPADARGLVPLADADRWLLAGGKLGRLRPNAALRPVRSVRSRSAAAGAVARHQFCSTTRCQMPKALDRGDADPRRAAADFRQ